ncbi:GntR family transcriptional regulator [Microbacterium capsulatum]|uniref:GntR family transcriptional regulator n=1 Tax=Microbacterium capsulatum TaxID=3041921 RepID=A0ABU0XEG1_9MICO|nr:GntR family transcriptional regulator [Microbacterium sp. ASV81]MDQ4213505.1 GntR family transcriptional regulator [Microbacterium sp. ASV81]
MRQTVRHASLGERLADQLRREIIRGELEVGAHLVEDTLAARYDVSRGPVRDAFKILSAEGLLDDRRRGFFVRGFSPRDVEELYSLRSSMEQLAMQRAAEQAEPEQWGAVEAELAGMYAAAEHRDWHVFAEHDLAFHGAFYRLSGHSRLQAMWDQYQPTFGAMLDVTNEQDIDLRPSADDHAALLALTREGRIPELAARLAEHLSGSERRMTTALAPFWARATAR